MEKAGHTGCAAAGGAEAQEGKKPAQLSSALAPEPSKEAGKESEEEKGMGNRLQGDYNMDKTEMVRFVKGSGKKGRSPKPQSKFQALGTIDEAVNETATSQMHELSDHDSKLGSNNLRSSNQIDFEESAGGNSNHKDSMQKVDLLNRSLSGRQEQ